MIIIAGPCAIESKSQMELVAKELSKLGVKFLRGGAFKPRTKPNSFQGLGEKGLKILNKVGKKYGMKTVTEVLDPRDVKLVSKYADVLQIGTRNMQNFALLKEVGKTRKTILLKRGLSATIDEWLQAAKYVSSEGNKNIILCERGIRTFETHVRYTLPLATVPYLKGKTPYKIIVDPSHGTGDAKLVPSMSKAAIACGADGLMIEVHPNPKKALSDGQQSLDLEQFKKLLHEILK